MAYQVHSKSLAFLHQRWTATAVFFRGRELSTRHEVEAATAFLRLETARFGRAKWVVHVARL